MSHYEIQKPASIPLQSALRRLPKMSDIRRVAELIGKRVRVQDHYSGKVTRLNDTPYGAFPGSDYPVIVRLDEDFRGHLQKEHAFKLTDVVLAE